MNPQSPAPIMPNQYQGPTPNIIVGLDLSLTGTGVAVVWDGAIRTNLIRSKGKLSDSLLERARRLDRLASEILTFIPEFALVVIEQPAYSQTGGSHHDRSGLWWLVVNKLAGFQRVVEVAPGTLKKYATGKGNARKDEMLAAAIRRYPAAEIVDNNIADAVHLAAMGSRHLGHPLEVDTVKISEAMTVPRWDA